MAQWVFLSPHFDDVVLSAGGLVWELTQRGDRVEIWTICAGDPPFDQPLTEYAQMLHMFWELGDQVPYQRSLEDAACCDVLGAAAYRRYTMPDNIYRYYRGTTDPVVKLPDDNMGPLEQDEAYLIPPVADFLKKNWAPGWELVTPLSIGHHRDHVLTRRAAECLGIPLWHFIDYPYMVQGEYNLQDWIPPDTEKLQVPLSPGGMKAWQDGFACHRSQINLFWGDEQEMRDSIERYHQAGYGDTLWRF